MQLSDGEKLILLMLCEIYDHLKVKGDTDTKLIQSAIFDGHLWALKEKLSGVFHGSEARPEVVSETTNILWMWTIIEETFERLSSDDQANVNNQTPAHIRSKFPGFDAKDELEYYSVATFKIDHMGQFSRFKGRDLNSHFSTLQRHRALFAAFEPIIHEAPYQLDADNLITILNAGR
ncbi:MAG TPA: YfbU family protein [Bryobacteraceae bacterium]|jgi:hypothetical protein|nr:YfbU family protein [Bryobacteraceae bacterium]